MRLLTFLVYVALGSLMTCPSNGQNQGMQRVIMQDQKGRFVTTYTGKNAVPTYTNTYLGSPYMGNIVWHQGALIYRDQREIPAQIAYDITLDQIYWRLNDSTETIQALPDEFSFEGHHFVSEQYKPLGISLVGYYELIYDGKTKLLCKWAKRLRLIEPKLYTHRIPLDDRFMGEYILFKDFYIQKEGERPKFIIPTEYSLSRILPNMGSKLADFIASHELTEQVLVETLIQYDNRPIAAH